MRFVEKTVAPVSFDVWKNSTDANWVPTYRDLRDPEKREVHEAVLQDQGGVCCYCGRSVLRTNSHLEHFLPQETRADLALEYSNILVSCIRDLRPGLPLHCGHAKGSGMDEALAISPLDKRCEDRFVYSLDGAILPADKGDAGAAYMVDLLRLDNSFLRNRRESTLGGIFDEEFIRSASNEELVDIIDAYVVRSPNGLFRDFSHVVTAFAKGLMQR